MHWGHGADETALSWNLHPGGAEVPGGTLKGFPSHLTFNPRSSQQPRRPPPYLLPSPSYSLNLPGTCCPLDSWPQGFCTSCALCRNALPQIFAWLASSVHPCLCCKVTFSETFSWIHPCKIAASISPDLLTLNYFFIAVSTAGYYLCLFLIPQGNESNLRAVTLSSVLSHPQHEDSPGNFLSAQLDC